MTHSTPTPRAPWLALSLLAMLALTRSGHFGTTLSLPDATLAVLFLLGLWCRPALWLGAALATAAVIDVVAVRGGVSSYCVTPAYAALTLAYAAPWLAGRLLAPRAGRGTWAFVPVATAALAAAALVAFLVSNASFFLWSGYFAALPVARYAAGVARYLPPYVGWTLAYGVAGLALEALYAHAASRRLSHAG
jgi:hypothetical protein